MKKKIKEIVIPSSRVLVNEDQVREMANSMERLGQLHPILVTDDGRLVSGRRRLAAAERLGWSEVEVDVAEYDDPLLVELAEIDENIVRSGLNALREAEALKRRQEIYALLNPESAKRATADIAAKTGKSQRAVQDAIQIVKGIDPDVIEAIKDTPIAESKADLRTISRQERAEQKRITEAVKTGKAKSVKAAVKPKPGSDRFLVFSTIASHVNAIQSALDEIEKSFSEYEVGDLVKEARGFCADAYSQVKAIRKLIPEEEV